MHRTFACLAFLASLLATSVGAAARPLDKRETQALEKSLTLYLKAIGQGDAEDIVAALPPRILARFAETAGMAPELLQETLIAQTRDLMKGTRFHDLAADQTALDATESSLADGTTVTWVLVPTSFVSETGSTKTRNVQPLLALREAGRWSFLRIDGPERQDLARMAYPFLDTARIPQATVTPDR